MSTVGNPPLLAVSPFQLQQEGVLPWVLWTEMGPSRALQLLLHGQLFASPRNRPESTLPKGKALGLPPSPTAPHPAFPSALLPFSLPPSPGSFPERDSRNSHSLSTTWLTAGWSPLPSTTIGQPLNSILASPPEGATPEPTLLSPHSSTLLSGDLCLWLASQGPPSLCWL